MNQLSQASLSSQAISLRKRASKALQHMSSMGLYTPKTKQVLRELLKSFDYNWEAIEADNYSVFVDALLSYDEEQGFIQKKVDPIQHDVIDENLEQNEGSVVDQPTPSRKRQRLQKKETTSKPFSDRGIPNEVAIQTHKSKEPQNTSGIANEASWRQDRPLLLSPLERFKGKDIVPDQMNMLHDEITPFSSRKQTLQKIPGSNSNQGSICLKMPKIESENDSIENCTPGNKNCAESADDISGSEESAVPIAIIYPDAPYSIVNGPAKKCLDENHSTLPKTNSESPSFPATYIDPSKKDTAESNHNDVTGLTNNDGISSIPVDSSKNVVIASSSKGEVRLSFALNGMNSEMCLPSLESVFRTVEERCLKSYKIIEPNFSFGSLLTEMCETLKELSESLEHERLVNITPRLDSQYNSNITPSYSKQNIFCDVSKTNGVLSSGMATAANHKSVLVDVRPMHDVNDIAKAEERMRISIVNEVSGEQFPPPFFYISRNIVIRNGHLDFSLARIEDVDCCSNCFGDCLSASTPCLCAKHTNGKYAYSSDGLVNKEFLDDCISRFHNPKQDLVYCKNCPIEKLKNEVIPESCKGHVVRKFIKECWVKCGCNKQCGNRVVQRGITCNLQVFYTAENKGWGLRTLDELPRGTFVCEYVGEILTNTELYERNQKGTTAKHTRPILLDAIWASDAALKDEDALCLDATYCGNIARFINHRCFDSNLIEIPVEVETPDHHYYHLAFFTSKKVEAFEELTWDYGIDFDDSCRPFQCRCGSRYCRGSRKKSRSSRSRAPVRQ